MKRLTHNTMAMNIVKLEINMSTKEDDVQHTQTIYTSCHINSVVCLNNTTIVLCIQQLFLFNT